MYSHILVVCVLKWCCVVIWLKSVRWGWFSHQTDSVWARYSPLQNLVPLSPQCTDVNKTQLRFSFMKRETREMFQTIFQINYNLPWMSTKNRMWHWNATPPEQIFLSSHTCLWWKWKDIDTAVLVLACPPVSMSSLPNCEYPQSQFKPMTNETKMATTVLKTLLLN